MWTLPKRLCLQRVNFRERNLGCVGSPGIFKLDAGRLVRSDLGLKVVTSPGSLEFESLQDLQRDFVGLASVSCEGPFSLSP